MYQYSAVSDAVKTRPMLRRGVNKRPPAYEMTSEKTEGLPAVGRRGRGKPLDVCAFHRGAALYLPPSPLIQLLCPN
jgi:hypothetical protein